MGIDTGARKSYHVCMAQKVKSLADYLRERVRRHSGVALRTSVQLYGDQITALDDMAETLGVSRSQSLRLLLDFALDQRGELAQPTGEQK